MKSNLLNMANRAVIATIEGLNVCGVNHSLSNILKEEDVSRAHKELTTLLYSKNINPLLTEVLQESAQLLFEINMALSQSTLN